MEAAMLRRLVLVVLCLAMLSACGDYYYAATFPESQFEPGNQ